MTTSQRINGSVAPSSVAPAQASKATTNAGGEDFAATLTQARGSSSAKETSTTGAAKQESNDTAKATSGASAESAAGAADAEQPSPETTVATNGVSNPRASRESKEAAAPTSEDVVPTSEGVVPSVLPLPADPAVVPNRAAALPPAEVASASQGSDVVADATTATSSAEATAAVLAGRSVTNDPATAAPSTAAAAVPVAAKSLPAEPLIATRGADVRASTALSADQTALTIVTDALQATGSAANEAASEVIDDLTSGSNAPTEDISDASLALMSLTSTVSGSDVTPATRAAPGTAQHVLHTPVGTRGWSDELATRLTVMLDQRQQSATLRLSPDNLGPLEVRIDVREGQVSVWFGAAQADTRAAIESALPRLRELLQDQGLSLADAGVFQQSHRDSPRHHGAAQSGAFSESEGAIEMSVALRVGLFDGYA